MDEFNSTRSFIKSATIRQGFFTKEILFHSKEVGGSEVREVKVFRPYSIFFVPPTLLNFLIHIKSNP